jgi:hypothetical protein
MFDQIARDISEPREAGADKIVFDVQFASRVDSVSDMVIPMEQLRLSLLFHFVPAGSDSARFVLMKITRRRSEFARDPSIDSQLSNSRHKV